jgi:hypothetical protein
MAPAAISGKTDPMEERGMAPDGSAVKPIATEELGPLWESWRHGNTVPCPADGGPLALAVDAGAQAYRLVCVRCGTASLWFETAPGTTTSPSAPGCRPAPRPGVTDD